MRVVVVGVLSGSVVTLRGEMLRAMAAAGHEVLAMAPEEDPVVRATLASMGVSYTTVPLDRASMNPLRDLRTVIALVRAFRAFHADAVLVYAAKPVIYGSIAARLARVPLRAAMITGIGSALVGGRGVTRRVLVGLVRGLYALALPHDHLVFFQNPDDEALFRSLGLLGRDQRIVRINGSGVDLKHYALVPLPPAPTRFIFIGRLIRDKGINEYVEAARRVRAVHPEARFQILGPLDPNPSAVSARDVEAWQAEGAVEYLGATDDVRPFLAAAHVCVLPSYAEGMPRAVLEAMAMGRPAIVTDVAGCRETVQAGVNGLLVPPRDSKALAAAMMQMLQPGCDLEAMGRRGRELAEERFDVHAVNRVILDAMGLSLVRQFFRRAIPAGNFRGRG